MRKLPGCFVGVLLFASVANATPITISFDTINPRTSQSEVWLTLTFTEGAGGVSMYATLLPGIELWEGWTFDGVWLESADRGKERQWSWEDLHSPVFLSGYSFFLLSGRWFDARWTGPCHFCQEEPERPEHESPSAENCEIVLREQFPSVTVPEPNDPNVVPEPSGLSLMLIGISGLAVRYRKRKS